MSYSKISANIFNCHSCPTRCDGKTVLQFDFKRDVKFSEEIEREVIGILNRKYPDFSSSKTTREGYPDIEIKKPGSGECVAFVEIKGQARTFMSIGKHLPQSKLNPSETLALNLSDRERYFEISKKETAGIYIVWCLMNRPCIIGTNRDDKLFFHQKLQVLEQIRLNDKNNTRKFKRASGAGDIVDGEHKGVVVNYHFSINELLPGLP